MLLSTVSYQESVCQGRKIVGGGRVVHEALPSFVSQFFLCKCGGLNKSLSYCSQAVNRYGATENTWGIYGKPPSIANMLETSTGTSTKLMDYYESEYDRSVKRQKKIAEDLTGGKME